VLFLFLLSVEKELRLAGSSMRQVVIQNVATKFCESVYKNYVPTFAFVQEQRSESVWFADRQITEIMPLYGYALKQEKETAFENDILSLDDILLAEAQEGTGMEQTTSTAQNVADRNNGKAATVKMGTETGGQENASLEALLQAENEAAMLAREAEAMLTKEFVPHPLQSEINLEELKNY